MPKVGAAGKATTTAAIGLQRADFGLLALLMLAFWAGVLRQIELPGLYMDAVFPDYLAASMLRPGLDNPVWALPRVTIPILGGLYHGAQNLYVDIAVFSVLGINLPALRVAQALFGAAIVVGLYCLALGVTGKRLAAFAGALLLATDIAFIASFRSQFYIILGAQAWLFASLLCLRRGDDIGRFGSGLFFGFAVYGYFVLAFFLPAMVLVERNWDLRRLCLWAAGLLAGLVPYLLGYLSLMIALGGPNGTWIWLNETVTSLAPLSSTLTASDRVAWAGRMAFLALSNGGNELMIFGVLLADVWSEAKAYVLVAATVIAALAALHRPALRLAWLPISFVALAAVLGSRLWVHHYIVVLPLAYAALGAVFARLPTGKAAASAIMAATALLLAVNLHHGNRFHQELNRTGGARMASDAMTIMAAEARRSQQTLYVFPDWGFFAPFALLTENQVPYLLDAAAIPRGGGAAAKVVIAFWNDGDEAKYAELLKLSGAGEVSTVVHRQRDGRTAFLTVQGRFR